MKLKLILYLGLCLLYGGQPVLAEDEVFIDSVTPEFVEPAAVNPEFAEPIGPEPVHRALTLSQRSIPEDIFVYPPEWANGEIFVQRMRFDENTGKRVGIVDFRVEGIRSDIDMDVYIAFSTRPIFDWEQKQGVALDSVSLEIISGVTLPARQVRHFFNQPTSFSLGGFAYVPSNSLVFAIDLEDLLSAPQLYSDELYFQAIAVPAGSTNFDAPDVQSSEVDFYRIVR
ncbi:hypothetical protein [Candidatus Albibeggiatoa sp. nov. NOAA]|uniref:hypothetical protein n=1 Tax=Candidatus Albibeggiatoa sp. nov. NOAA TaxID=3162724 RepID=UPI0032FEA155|nr:hypothetical protein [Thiotrichaceae bacterium]